MRGVGAVLGQDSGLRVMPAPPKKGSRAMGKMDWWPKRGCCEAWNFVATAHTPTCDIPLTL